MITTHPAIDAALRVGAALAISISGGKDGRSANDWREARRFAGRVDGTASLGPLFEVLE
jgi:hypothetical protein